MFGWELPPYNSGGLGVACEGLARALRSSGAHITFVLPRRADVDDKSLEVMFANDKEITVETVNALLAPYMTSSQYQKLLETEGVSLYGSSLFEEVVRYGLAAQRIAKRVDFDIIHAHEWLSFAAGLAAKRVSGKPLVLHVHATEFDRSGFQGVNQQVYDLERKAFEKADSIIAVSQYTKSIIVEHYSIDPDKIFVVYNGISEEEIGQAERMPKSDSLKPVPGSKMVLFVGRLTLHKGPDYFLQAAKKVAELYPNVVFMIAGSGEMEHQLIEESAKLGIADKVFFTGFLRGEELRKLYKASDLCVFPSISEPFGLTTLESLINGTPVLVSKQSGVSEILSHTLKADFWDIDDMTDKILAVLQYGSLMENLSCNGHREAKDKTWGRAAQKCLSVYKRLANHL